MFKKARPEDFEDGPTLLVLLLLLREETTGGATSRVLSPQHHYRVYNSRGRTGRDMTGKGSTDKGRFLTL